jgi:putative flippase GtrA
MSLLNRYRLMPENARLVITATLGAAIGLLTYEIVYLVMPFEPRATLSWIFAFAVGIARQHGLHRWLTFADRSSLYWPSLRRAYVMYSGSFLVGALLDWILTEQAGVHHRLAWACCLLTTMTISFVFLRNFVFSENDS